MIGGRIDYPEFPGFADVYLEDSYVLDIQQSGSELAFRMDLVLRESHPAYRPPRPNEQYCFRRGTIVFPDLREIRWIKRTDHPAVDATGEVDYGNIDEMWLANGTCHISGDWGEVELRSAPPSIALEPEN